MASKTYFSPLRYPGGKGRIAPWIADLMSHNNIKGRQYVEPYAGGAGVALYLLFHEYASNVIINDIDLGLYHFWLNAVNHSERMLDKLESIPVTVDEWQKQKHIYANRKNCLSFDVGFATLFLNRCNRSGVMEGGIIGGKEQTGSYKIDARFNKKELKNRLERISKYRKQIDVKNWNANKLLTEKPFSQESFLFLDPPYFNKAERLYHNHYRPGDHKEIADIIQSLSMPWVITYDDCPEIRDLYPEHTPVPFDILYSVREVRKGKEILMYGNMDAVKEVEINPPSI